MDFAPVQDPVYIDEHSKSVGQARFQTPAIAAPPGPLELGGADLQLYLSPDGQDEASVVDTVEETEELDTSTRPRLNPDQVSVLERQFQYYHKPNSSVKQQLATQTGLSLPRVAVSSPSRVLVVWKGTTLMRCVELVSKSQSQSETAKETRTTSHADSRDRTGLELRTIDDTDLIHPSRLSSFRARIHSSTVNSNRCFRHRDGRFESGESVRVVGRSELCILAACHYRCRGRSRHLSGWFPGEQNRNGDT